jgi:methyl-accepting chemotaxis protein
MVSEMQTKTRLILAFGVMILFIIAVGAVGILNVNSLKNSVDDIANDKFPKTVWANNLVDATNAISMAMSKAVLFQDPRRRQQQLDAIEAEKRKALSNMQRLEALITTEEGKEKIDALIASRDEKLRYYERFIELVRANEIEQAEALLVGEIQQLQSEYLSNTAALIEYQGELMNQAGAEARQRATMTTTMIMLVGGLALVVAILIAFGITRKLIRQLGGEPAYAADRVNEIAAGHLDTPIALRDGDETSLLASLKGLQNVLEAFISDLLALTERHQEGWTNETIDTSGYPGAYGEIGEKVNQLLRGHIDTKTQMVSVITDYSRGNFAPDMPQLPGDEAKITEAIGGVKQGLVSVSREIKTVASAGSQGNFSNRGRADDYDFMFREMLNDLNQLMENCEVGFVDVMRVSKAIAEGDLTQTITKDYPGVFGETKMTINETVARLRELVGQIQGSAESITTASKEIASGNEDLSSRTEQQASSLQETAASMEELTATVKQNAQNADQANQVSMTASEAADKGGEVMRRSVATMQEISDVSEKMSDIITVIDGIAFQTNILALNASVEAARAGEQGRGFAVVATEVRNLAQRTAEAAKEITGLITDAGEKVDSGTRSVGEAGTRMDEIVTSITRVTDLMNEISAASKEQSAGIEQVNQATTEMETVAQQNAALVEEAAAAASSLDEQAQSLVTAVSAFRLDQGGSAERAAEPQRGQASSNRSRPEAGQQNAKPGTNIRPIRSESHRHAVQVSTPEGATAEWVEF